MKKLLQVLFQLGCLALCCLLLREIVRMVLDSGQQADSDKTSI